MVAIQGSALPSLTRSWRPLPAAVRVLCDEVAAQWEVPGSQSVENWGELCFPHVALVVTAYPWVALRQKHHVGAQLLRG